MWLMTTGVDNVTRRVGVSIVMMEHGRIENMRRVEVDLQVTYLSNKVSMERLAGPVESSFCRRSGHGERKRER